MGGERKCRPGWWNPSYDTLAELPLVGVLSMQSYIVSLLMGGDQLTQPYGEIACSIFGSYPVLLDAVWTIAPRPSELAEQDQDFPCFSSGSTGWHLVWTSSRNVSRGLLVCRPVVCGEARWGWSNWRDSGATSSRYSTSLSTPESGMDYI